MKLSVVIPVHNRAKSIRSTLISVQKQSFSDFECIIVDDGSDDAPELRDVVESLLDPRFKYVWKQNGGASSARNRGLDIAQGSFVALLDSDDQFLPNKLERCFKEIIRRQFGNSDRFLIFSQMRVDRGVGKYWLKPKRGVSVGQRVDEYLMTTSGWIQTSTMVLPTSFAKMVRFDERLPSSQDTDFAIRAASGGAEIIFINEPLVVLNDIHDRVRVSKQSNFTALLDWIERMRSEGHISDRSYWAYRGWQCARIASKQNMALALKLYGAALRRRSYGIKQSIVVFLQIVLPSSAYQMVATSVVASLGRGAKSGDHEK